MFGKKGGSGQVLVERDMGRLALQTLREALLEDVVQGDGLQMPREAGVLDDATMHVIESWILQGAQD